MVAAILLAVALYGVIVPSLTQLFPSATLARMLREAGCRNPAAVAAPAIRSRAWCSWPAPRPSWSMAPMPPISCARGACRFALVEARHERAFLQRADGDRLRYSPPQRIEAINYSDRPRDHDRGLSLRGAP